MKHSSSSYIVVVVVAVVVPFSFAENKTISLFIEAFSAVKSRGYKINQ